MADDPSALSEPVQDPLVEDVLVEEISIDGMCGVY
jgi:mycofactocin precursor